MAELTPIYELRLGDGDTSEQIIQAIEGSSLEIRCVVSSNEISEKPITMLKDGQIVETERSTVSATIAIPSFKAEENNGMYECSTVLGEKRIRRRLKIMHKVVLPPHMIPCTGGEFCKNGGVCGLGDDLTKLCHCPVGYFGPHCEEVAIRDGLCDRAKLGVVAGGTCNLVFIFFLVILGLLFFRERKRRRIVEKMMNDFSSNNQQRLFESIPLVKDHLYADDVYSKSEPVMYPPEKRCGTPTGVHNGKFVVRTNAVKKVIAPGEEDDSVQPHSS